MDNEALQGGKHDQIRIDRVFGYVRLDSWMRPCANGFEGMSRKRQYDKRKKLISDKTEQTGVRVIYE